MGLPLEVLQPTQTTRFETAPDDNTAEVLNFTAAALRRGVFNSERLKLLESQSLQYPDLATAVFEINNLEDATPDSLRQTLYDHHGELRLESALSPIRAINQVSIPLMKQHLVASAVSNEGYVFAYCKQTDCFEAGNSHISEKWISLPDKAVQPAISKNGYYDDIQPAFHEHYQEMTNRYRRNLATALGAFVPYLKTESAVFSQTASERDRFRLASQERQERIRQRIVRRLIGQEAMYAEMYGYYG